MTPDLPAVERTIIELTNEVRRAHALQEVRRSPTLDQAAQSYAQFLARTGTFSHTADGRRPGERATAAGYDFCIVSENLASSLDTRGFTDRGLADAAIEGWKNSPGHRRNMLEPHVTEIGVGVARVAGIHEYLSVQVFGRPAALRLSFSIRNTTDRSVAYQLGDQPHDVEPQVDVTHTMCIPEPLVFRDVSAEGSPGGEIASQFETRDGDVFVIRTTDRGTPVVSYEPRDRR
ncbi:MAG: CAP domain-containing protein [Hyphomicrobiaceae bacterium]